MKHIRAGRFDGNKVSLCDHIQIYGVPRTINRDYLKTGQKYIDDNCEYTELVMCRCSVCKKTYGYNLLIN